MKTIKNKMCRVNDDKTSSATSGTHSFHSSRKARHAPAFTLIELLVVITVMAVLAGLTLPVLSVVKRHQYINHTQGEMAQLEAAIDSYHAAYGFYPPGNQLNAANGVINQLYYELAGVTNNASGVNPSFQTLDGRATIASSDVQATFGVAGIMNCTKPGAGEDSPKAKSFLFELRPSQLGTNGISLGNILFLDASVGGPDVTYSPPPVSGLNPWRYVSPGINNPNSYDLWVQLSIAGKKYLVCNWNKQVQVNNNSVN
jgi:prepilin-type N-terminal cleavage/methylation domain-containing protein